MENSIDTVNNLQMQQPEVTSYYYSEWQDKSLPNVSFILNPSYTTVYDFEKYDPEKWRVWMSQYWHWSIYASLIYVITIFSGQKFMKYRAPFQLKNALTIWNTALALFSIVAFTRSVPEIVHVLLKPDGFYQSVCLRHHHNIATSYWGFLFVLSKIVEFGDTAFIVLRKRPLIFLHWYHHATVCCFCWFSYHSHDQSSRWFVTMNLFVHSLMYSYFALMSVGVKFPKPLSITLTCLQLSQMFIGVYVNIYSYILIQKNEVECDRSQTDIMIAFGMYASYGVLFANFFYNAYLKKKSKNH